jgi:hypothetical protein
MRERTPPTASPLTLVTTVFGPRYTVQTRNQRYALVGKGFGGHIERLPQPSLDDSK